MWQRIWQGRLVWLRLVLLLAVGLLVLIGVLTIYASTDPADHYARRQLVFVALGLAGLVVANLIPYHALGRYSYGLFALAVVLLTLVLAGKYLHLKALVPPSHGACRWINLIPIESDSPLVNAAHLQPSEIAKLTYVLALAWYLRLRRNYRTFLGLLGPFLLTLLPMALILLEPDLGTVLLFLPVLFAVLFAAGARVKHLLTIALLALAVVPVFYRFMMQDYQRERIAILLKQDTDDPYWLRGPGYQLHQSKVCIGSGGLTGHGLERSPYVRYRPWPHRHNDFIFTMVAHQGGFLGALILLILYLLVLLGGLVVAARQTEPFGRLLAVGVTALLAAQMFVNVGMTTGLMPVTGITLPFVSYGGSSLLASFLALGLLLNVARFRPRRIAKPAFEFPDE